MSNVVYYMWRAELKELVKQCNLYRIMWKCVIAYDETVSKGVNAGLRYYRFQELRSHGLKLVFLRKNYSGLYFDKIVSCSLTRYRALVF